MGRRPLRQIDVPHVAYQPILNLPDRCTQCWRAGVGERAKKHWGKCCQDVDALLIIYLFASLLYAACAVHLTLLRGQL